MSYCRFAWEGSEVYVFEAADGLTCCGCRLLAEGFVCQDPDAMIAHLIAHRARGSSYQSTRFSGCGPTSPVRHVRLDLSLAR